MIGWLWLRESMLCIWDENNKLSCLSNGLSAFILFFQREPRLNSLLSNIMAVKQINMAGLRQLTSDVNTQNQDGKKPQTCIHRSLLWSDNCREAEKWNPRWDERFANLLWHHRHNVVLQNKSWCPLVAGNSYLLWQSGIKERKSWTTRLNIFRLIFRRSRLTP